MILLFNNLILMVSNLNKYSLFKNEKNFPSYLQLDKADCGPTCLRMIAKYYGKNYSIQYLASKAFITREGVSMLGISDAAESIGFRTSGVRITLRQLKEDVPEKRPYAACPAGDAGNRRDHHRRPEADRTLHPAGKENLERGNKPVKRTKQGKKDIKIGTKIYSRKIFSAK